MLSLAGILAAVGAAAIAWGLYFALKDRYEPEPRLLLLVTFLLGAAATGPAWLLYRLAEGAGAGPELADPSAARLPALLYCVLLVGLVEEGCKMLPVLSLIGRHHEFDEPVDGLVYAAMGGLGFAAAESLVLGRFLDGPELWGRVVASPLTHALFAAVWGAALSLDRFARPRRPVRLAAGLAAAALLHGLYDYLTLAGSLAHRLAAAGLVLVVWIGFFAAMARFRSRSPFRRRGSGPDEGH